MTFVSKSTIINWFNSYNITIDKIENIGKGDKLIELINILIENNMLNTNTTICNTGITDYKSNPTNPTDYAYNLNKVKYCLCKYNIKIYFPIDRMVRLTYQDNLEFIQILYNTIHNTINVNKYGKRRNSIFEIMNIDNNTNINVSDNINSNKVNFINNNIKDDTNIIKGDTNIDENDILLKELNETRVKLHNSNNDTYNNNIIFNNDTHNNNVCNTDDKYKNKVKRLVSEMNYYYNKLVRVEQVVNSKMEDGEVKREILDILYEE